MCHTYGNEWQCPIHVYAKHHALNKIFHTFDPFSGLFLSVCKQTPNGVKTTHFVINFRSLKKKQFHLNQNKKKASHSKQSKRQTLFFHSKLKQKVALKHFNNSNWMVLSLMKRFSFPVLPIDFIGFIGSWHLYGNVKVAVTVKIVETQEIMVLLPKPPAPKESNNQIQRNIFFENDSMENLAKHFVGNNYRFVRTVIVGKLSCKRRETQRNT